DIGLGDGLPFRDRQRGILIGEFLHARRHEALARNAVHGVEHAGIGDPSAREMAFDHLVPGIFEIEHRSLHENQSARRRTVPLRVAGHPLPWALPPSRLRARPPESSRVNWTTTGTSARITAPNGLSSASAWGKIRSLNRTCLIRRAATVNRSGPTGSMSG